MNYEVQGAQISVSSLDGDRAKLVLRGEFDLDNSGALEQALTDRLDAGCCSVTLEAYGVTFMDSTVLSVLVRAHQRCAGAGGALQLVGARGNVARLVETTGLDQIMRPRPTE